MFHFFTPWKRQKTFDFLVLWGGIETLHLVEMSSEICFQIPENRRKNYLFNESNTTTFRVFMDDVFLANFEHVCICFWAFICFNHKKETRGNPLTHKI